MSAIPTQPRPLPGLAGRVPPLENGDRLTRSEFERRYSAMPGVKKAELIEGVVYMPSPVRLKRHAKPHLMLGGWLGYYLARMRGLDTFGGNGTVRLDEDNEPEPDLFLALPKSLGGRTTVSDDDYVEGAPELTCEVAGSSVNIDLHHKLNAYRRNGVREYVVWRTEDAAVDWFILRDGRYDASTPAADGTLRSPLFPGLRLDVAALIRGDLPALFAAIDRGIATPEHADFVAGLRRKRFLAVRVMWC